MNRAVEVSIPTPVDSTDSALLNTATTLTTTDGDLATRLSGMVYYAADGKLYFCDCATGSQTCHMRTVGTNLTVASQSAEDLFSRQWIELGHGLAIMDTDWANTYAGV